MSSFFLVIVVVVVVVVFLNYLLQVVYRGAGERNRLLSFLYPFAMI